MKTILKKEQIVDDIKTLAEYVVKDINREEKEVGKISDYDNGLREGLRIILERIERYEEKINYDK